MVMYTTTYKTCAI